MAEKLKKRTTTIMVSVVLVFVLIGAIGIYAYTSLVNNESTNSSSTNEHSVVPPSADNTSEEVVLIIRVGSDTYTYSMDDLLGFDSTSGQGSFINKVGTISGPFTYIGVAVPMLLDQIEGLPDMYTMLGIASDNYSVDYTMDNVTGHVMLYDENGTELGIGTVTMIIAYYEDGVPLDESIGPLRIAFVAEDGAITHSSLWLRSLVELDVI
jgi:hypothetical protein